MDGNLAMANEIVYQKEHDFERDEFWKTIEGYENYQVSNLGRVKSLERYAKSGNSTYIKVKERILRSGTNPDGYYIVVLCNNGKTKTKKVHQLVAIYFLNHKPNGVNMVVNHKDFNKQNNNVENLEIITNRENCNKKHIKHSSIYTGVHWSTYRKGWISKINIHNKDYYLGCFDNEYDAHLAYENKLKTL